VTNGNASLIHLQIVIAQSGNTIHEMVMIQGSRPRPTESASRLPSSKKFRFNQERLPSKRARDIPPARFFSVPYANPNALRTQASQTAGWRGNWVSDGPEFLSEPSERF
jgi:hypothetical protein